MTRELIAVVDVGKTHAKLVVVEADDGTILWQTQTMNASVKGPLGLALNLRGLERWLLSSLNTAPERARIRHLVPVAHGAAAVLVDAQGQVLAAPDYEDLVLD